MDTVRTALRNGSGKPFIIYRRSENEMPASEEEIHECREEGIEIMTLTNPKRIIGENGRVKAIECVRMQLGEPDASGRRRPVTIPGSEFTIEVDSVVPAIDSSGRYKVALKDIKKIEVYQNDNSRITLSWGIALGLSGALAVFVLAEVLTFASVISF